MIVCGKRFTSAMKRLLFGVVLWGCLAEVAMAREQSVHALRSAYLYYFSNMIEWPNGVTFGDGQLQLCALTVDVNSQFQLKTIAGKSIRDLTLNIVFLNAGDFYSSKVNACHIVYVDEGSAKGLVERYDLPETTLLVTEGQVEKVGSIHLFVENKKLKFEVNTQRLAKKSFKVSSKLLRLSRSRAR